MAEFGTAEIKRALQRVVDHWDAYLDLDDGSEAWVAAELVAASAGIERSRTGNEPDTHAAAIAAIAVDEHLVVTSLKVLQRLELGDNELRGLLEDAEELVPWQAQLDSLRQRLRSFCQQRS